MLHLSDEDAIYDGEFDLIGNKGHIELHINHITSIASSESENLPPYNQCYNDCLFSVQKNVSYGASQTSSAFILVCKLQCIQSKFTAWELMDYNSFQSVLSKGSIKVKMLTSKYLWKSFIVKFRIKSEYFTIIEEFKNYSFFNLFNDIGGIIGFIIGSSILKVGYIAINPIIKIFKMCQLKIRSI